MPNTSLRPELHKAIDDLDDNSLLAAIYTILKREALPEDDELSPEQLSIAADRR